jgi:hypothetical protein
LGQVIQLPILPRQTEKLVKLEKSWPSEASSSNPEHTAYQRKPAGTFYILFAKICKKL